MHEDALTLDESRHQDDEIVAEVRTTRDQLGAAVGHDLKRLIDQLKEIESVERARGRTVLALLASEVR